MRKYTFIVNPKAGRGTGEKALIELSRHLAGGVPEYEIVETSRRGDATIIARKTACDICVAVGGDGTISEVASGLDGTSKVLGVIPAGCGNDFAKSIAVPTNVSAALEVVRAGRVREIDIGTVRCSTNAGGKRSSNQSKSVFVNGVGIGFDAAVAARTRTIRHLSGTLLYIVAVLRTLGRYRSPEFSMAIDGKHWTSRNLLIAVGNGVCAGGGFYLTPDASVDDGILDVCLIDEMPVVRILQLMPRVMKGRHGSFPEVRFERGKSIAVTGDRPFFVHADGEIVGENVTSVEIDVLPKSLRVITG